MRLFTFSELWGMAPCYICGKQTFMSILSSNEENQISELDGAEASNLICIKKLGKAVCDDHCRENKIDKQL